MPQMRSTIVWWSSVASVVCAGAVAATFLRTAPATNARGGDRICEELLGRLAFYRMEPAQTGALGPGAGTIADVRRSLEYIEGRLKEAGCPS